MPDPDALALRVGLRGVPGTQPAVFYPGHQLYGAVKGEGRASRLQQASLSQWEAARGQLLGKHAPSRRQSLLC